MKKGTIRTFATGATRDSNEGKLEYARFFDPRVMRTLAEYMHVNRVQSDGALRDPDNWKKGITKRAYMDSLTRHYMQVWEIHEYGSAIDSKTGKPVVLKDALCGLLFNGMGFLFEVLREEAATR